MAAEINLAELSKFVQEKINSNPMLRNQAMAAPNGEQYLQLLSSGDVNAQQQAALSYLQSIGVSTDQQGIQEFVGQNIGPLTQFFHFG